VFKRTTVQLTIVIAVAAIVLFLNLGSARLWDRDEPRNAGCAAEMMQRGDWIVPMFNDELRHRSPYCVLADRLAYQVFGNNELAARFWSALLYGNVVMTHHWATLAESRGSDLGGLLWQPV
jgi:4-amino-4-deoxy-L-arabinose transferase-like glycosyltransferase